MIRGLFEVDLTHGVIYISVVIVASITCNFKVLLLSICHFVPLELVLVRVIIDTGMRHLRVHL